MNPIERRRDIRVRLSLSADRLRIGGPQHIHIVEASYRGLFLEMDEPPPLNELFQLRVELPQRQIVLHAVAVRVGTCDGARGVGCRLFALNGADKIDWQMYIRSLIQSVAMRRAA